jgi:hypothetical protein
MVQEHPKDDQDDGSGTEDDNEDEDDDYCMIRSSNGNEARKISKAMLQEVGIRCNYMRCLVVVVK